eukprot:8129047-Alexandrium_andersonii.AAC.1
MSAATPRASSTQGSGARYIRAAGGRGPQSLRTRDLELRIQTQRLILVTPPPGRGADEPLRCSEGRVLTAPRVGGG